MTHRTKLLDRQTDEQTSFHGDDLSPEHLSLLFHLQLVILNITQFTLDSFTQFVDFLNLLLQLAYLILLRLNNNNKFNPLTTTVGIWVQL